MTPPHTSLRFHYKYISLKQFLLKLDLSSLSLTPHFLFHFLSTSNFFPKAKKMSRSILSTRACAYTKMDKEDPEELMHRRAQFLIYKLLEQADSRTRPSWLHVRISKLKIRRLKKLRKSILLNIIAAKGSFYKRLISQLKTWKRLFRIRQTILSLPPTLI